MQDQLTVYEQPLNERIRAFLRLEFLFEQVEYCLGRNSTWDSRSAMNAILDIIALLGRADLRTELIKELERQITTFETLSNNPGVDQALLTDVLERIKPLSMALRNNEPGSMTGQDLREHELLSCVRQRNSIPAGTCSFDIPGFQYWLEQPAESRLAELNQWLSSFDLFKNAIRLCLDLVRNSASSTRELASQGFYQRSLEGNSTCQLIRVLFPGGLDCFPEISGGRHRFSIRFLELHSSDQRPVQSRKDVEFELQCCMI